MSFNFKFEIVDVIFVCFCCHEVYNCVKLVLLMVFQSKLENVEIQIANIQVECCFPFVVFDKQQTTSKKHIARRCWFLRDNANGTQRVNVAVILFLGADLSRCVIKIKLAPVFEFIFVICSLKCRCQCWYYWDVIDILLSILLLTNLIFYRCL